MAIHRYRRPRRRARRERQFPLVSLFLFLVTVGLFLVTVGLLVFTVSSSARHNFLAWHRGVALGFQARIKSLTRRDSSVEFRRRMNATEVGSSSLQMAKETTTPTMMQETNPPPSHSQQGMESVPFESNVTVPLDDKDVEGSEIRLSSATVSRLLGVKLDSLLSKSVIDEKVPISCGGHPIMSFRNTFDLYNANHEIYKVLPAADPTSGTDFGRCAVVGNSGDLSDHNHGKLIDMHDTVIRFNAAPTQGYERHVGRKTTIRLQNVDNIGWHEHHDKYLIFSVRELHSLSQFIEYKKEHPHRHVQYAMNPEFWCHVWDWVLDKKAKPSTGFAGIVLALKICKQVSLFGFSHNSTRFHYFNKLPREVREEIYTYHPLIEEAAVYRELETLGLIKTYS